MLRPLRIIKIHLYTINHIIEKKTKGGEMGFQFLVRPHHLLFFDGLQSSMTRSNGHQFLFSIFCFFVLIIYIYITE